MSNSKDVEIPVPWGTISGKWWGPDSNEPIIFIHGWQDNLGSFDRLIPLLPRDLPYFTFDLPGHGLSSCLPKGGYNYVFWDGLLVVRRLVKHFGWKKISIIGHSLGGAVGFLYAASFPDEINRLCCIDIACPRVSRPSTLASLCGKSVDKFLEYDSHDDETKQPRYEMEEMISIALDGYKGSVNRIGVETLLKRGTKQSQLEPDKLIFSRDVRLKAVNLGMPSLDIVLEYASQIKCHYLNVKANEGLTLESPEVYPMVLGRIKQSAASFEFHEIPGTHHVHLNTPEVVAPIIGKFLKSA